jgi:hypothetical protein
VTAPRAYIVRETQRPRTRLRPYQSSRACKRRDARLDRLGPAREVAQIGAGARTHPRAGGRARERDQPPRGAPGGRREGQRRVAAPATISAYLDGVAALQGRLARNDAGAANEFLRDLIDHIEIAPRQANGPINLVI